MKKAASGTAFSSALYTSMPVFFGYTSIGFAFGFLLVKAGFEWFWAPVMSVIIYAGAAQFLAVGMLAEGKTPLEMALAVFLLNARHMVYGFSLLERYTHYRRSRPYLIFGLTDETYGLLTTVPPPAGVNEERFDLYITGLNQSYWVAGSILGALLGTYIAWDAPGIEFSMTALFTVLLVEQILNVRRASPFIVSLLICVILLLLGVQNMLLPAIVLSSLGMFFIKGREK